MAGEGVTAPTATTRTTPERRRADVRAVSPVAWGPVLLVAGLLLAVLLVYADRYGPHRDELYFAEAGRHLAWGYSDQPPLTPAIARLATLVAPGSVAALHVPAALALAGMVVLAGLSACELGGRIAAQVLTVVATGTGVVTVVLGHMLSTASVDAFFRAAVAYAALVTLRRDRPRLWLVVAGVGLEDKNTVVFLLGAMLVGVTVVPATRHHLRSPWLWAGGGVALVLWLPNLIWQASHGWPQLTLASDINAEHGTARRAVGVRRAPGRPLQPTGRGDLGLRAGPALACGRPRRGAAVRLGVRRAGGLLPRDRGQGVLPHRARPRAGRRRVLRARRAVGPPHARGDGRRRERDLDRVLAGGAPRPLAPRLRGLVLRRDQRGPGRDDRLARLRPHCRRRRPCARGDRRRHRELRRGGSPRLVRVVRARVLRPQRLCGLGHPPGSAGPFVLVGYDTVPAWAKGCRVVAHIDNGADVDNEEQGGAVCVCAGPTGSWASVWPQVRHLDA